MDLPRPIQLLVHNVTHSDVVIDCESPTFRPRRDDVRCLHRAQRPRRDPLETATASSTQTITIRPKFNAFLRATSDLLERLESVTKLAPVRSPYRSPASAERTTTGFTIPASSSTFGRWADFHIADDGREVDASRPPLPRAVHFPLIATILPAWIELVNRKHSSHGKKVLILLSGTAAPRVVAPASGVPSGSHPGSPSIATSNSTDAAAKLIKRFVKSFFPDVTVAHVHSGSGIFRFNHNVEFINHSLKPMIRAHCVRLAKALGDDWTDFFHMFISLTDGSPARISALNAGLREFRPDYLHVLQPKSFFYSHVVSTANIYFASFDKIDVRPPMPRSKLPSRVRDLVDEMIAFKSRFLRQKSDEIRTFWLRKTRKPVLAVLLVERDQATSSSEKVTFFYGINMEVSMPTGSLCAERNCIGTALSSNVGLMRRDIKMIAVLSMEPVDRANDDSPTLVSASDKTLREAEAVSSSVSNSPHRRIKRRRLGSSYDKFLQTHDDDTCHSHSASCSSSSSLRRSRKGDVADGTQNPISPCGACMEWLRKISEVNPDFRVVTFSDSSCESVFVRTIQAIPN